MMIKKAEILLINTNSLNMIMTGGQRYDGKTVNNKF